MSKFHIIFQHVQCENSRWKSAILFNTILQMSIETLQLPAPPLHCLPTTRRRRCQLLSREIYLYSQTTTKQAAGVIASLLWRYRHVFCAECAAAVNEVRESLYRSNNTWTSKRQYGCHRAMACTTAITHSNIWPWCDLESDVSTVDSQQNIRQQT